MKGLGNDIIEIDRVKSAHQEHGDAFLGRLFTEREQAYCQSCQNPYPRLAGRFAAKEAIAKALGSGFGAELSWKDIEILPDDQGKPVVHLSGAIKKKCADSQILVSISHCKQFASAVAVIF